MPALSSKDAARKILEKSLASAASPDSVKLQAVIKSAASAASLRRGRAGDRHFHGIFVAIVGRARSKTLVKTSDPVVLEGP